MVNLTGIFTPDIFRKRIDLRPEEALFFFVNGTIPATSHTMGEVRIILRAEFSVGKTLRTIIFCRSFNLKYLGIPTKSR